MILNIIKKSIKATLGIVSVSVLTTLVIAGVYELSFMCLSKFTDLKGLELDTYSKCIVIGFIMWVILVLVIAIKELEAQND